MDLERIEEKSQNYSFDGKSLKTSADGQPGSGPDYSQYIDYISQQIQGSGLVISTGMPDDRSICVYQGSTFGITECHTVGINLSILPDGSVSFIPLPSVGSGD